MGTSLFFPKIVPISYLYFYSSLQNLLLNLDPPSVTVETTSLDYLEEEKDSVSLRCIAESNPQPKIVWYKESENGIFSVEKEIHISPVTRHSAGTYKCVAENSLGLSEPAFVDLDVKCKYVRS